MKKAVIIFSGGMDSITLLHDLKWQGYECYGLSFDYGQRHRKDTCKHQDPRLRHDLSPPP